MQAITPGHFLINEPLVLPPPIDSFWIVWKKEYLATLIQRKKWRQQKEPLKVGQIVVIDDDMPVTHWRLGKIIKLIPSADKIIRAVRIRTTNKKKLITELVRPVQKLCVLPIEIEFVIPNTH